jgi:catechol 2,3-dioxygenase-like lactoylglutathione lyase family enzyme
MRIVLTSVFVDDQEKALRFYTGKLGFVKKEDVPLADSSITAVGRRCGVTP